MMLIGRFCKFPKRKTVNYHMQVVRREESLENPVIIEVKISYQERNYQGIVLFGSDGALAPNGPAIKGGCGTWRSHPATYPGTLAVIYPGGKTGMACFLQIQA
jgi:hypothetical protein